MELRILGPLEVVTSDGVVAPRAGKQGVLLSFLILHANERIGADRLIDALWGERPPATAASALQNQVTQLRRLLGVERIETVASTYLLHLEPGELDLARFEELMRRARPAPAAERVELLGSALALWRGRPLADVGDELFAQSEIARLEELHLVALELRLEAELELGRSAALIPELEALTRQHPLRENLRAKLMLALYRDGRQADALEVYHQTRRLLVDELGIEPQQPLQRLHQQILLQDTTLDLFPPPVALAASVPTATEPVPSPPVRPREVRKSVTALLLSVEVPAVEDPELLRGLGERAGATVRMAVERHGGLIQETVGAGVLAIFGLPVLHEDDALRALRAADETRVALDAGLAFRAGVATGVVIAAAEAAGPPVNAARELERRAGRGEILLDLATQRLVRDAVDWESAGDEALRLVRLDPAAPAIARRPDAPLVDRDRELLLLETTFAQAVRSSSCHLFTVCGQAGIGKSRLVAELSRTLGDRAIALTGQCIAYGDGITYWPVIQIVRSAAGLGADDSADARDRIADLVPGPDGEAVADRLASLLELGPVPARDEIAWALRRLLEALAATRPVVVVIDDLQHAEPTLLDLLEGLVDQSHGAPILLVGLTRPELLDTRPTWGGGKANALTISLEPLDVHDSGLLLMNLPGGSELDPGLRTRVVEAAGGHPLFVEELLTMLNEQDRVLGGDDDLPLPPTVHVLIAARLEQLPDAERLVLECGAVEGETFHAAALAALAPELDPHARTAALERLLHRNLVRRVEPEIAGGEAYRFRHALVREEAYAALPKAQRAARHEAFAAWLEEAAAQRLAEFEEILAFHLEQAFRLSEELGSLDDERRSLGERAGRLLASAGRRAFERADRPAAESLLGRAAALLPLDDEERLRLLVDLGCAERQQGKFERAAATLTDAASRSGATGRRSTQAHAELELAMLATLNYAADGFEELVRVAETLIADPAAAENRVAVARAYYTLGTTAWSALDVGGAAELFRQGRDVAAEAGLRNVARDGQVAMARMFIFGSTPVDDALAELAPLLDAARGDPASEAMLMIYAGPLESMRGRFDDARSLLAQGAEQLDDLGNRVLRASLDYCAVVAELAAGDAVAAEQIAGRALATLSAFGDRTNASLIAVLLAEALHRQGRDEEAEPHLAFAEDVHAGWLLHRVPVLITRAKVLARRGDAAEAEVLARRAIGLLEPTDALVLRGDAHLGLAEALNAAANLDAATSAAAQAAACYGAKGASALVAQAAARLEELGVR
jgi:DNA-binding SARP family transcriptional activator/class 3 adenylate cyclase